MIFKSATYSARDINVLKGLLDRPDLPPGINTKIQKEIKAIAAGAKGEADAAYHINFEYERSKNWGIIHDLRVEHGGRVAQIDHIIINRFLQMWVCETKYFAQGVAINAHGEFTSFYGSKPYAIPSPLEQNRMHCKVLASVFDDGVIQLPRRLGGSIKPELNSLILVSKQARITRPDVKIKGVESIIKVDQLYAHVEQVVEKLSIRYFPRVVGPKTMHNFANQLVALHRPIPFNWAAKFGLPKDEQQAPLKGRRAKKFKLICANCKVAVPFNTAKLCWFNKEKFGESIYCWDCQQTYNADK